MNDKYQNALRHMRASCVNRYFVNLKQYADDILQELVDKEKPMKLCGDGDEFICPKCNKSLCICEVQNEANYCSNCGQKLDWSDE